MVQLQRWRQKIFFAFFCTNTFAKFSFTIWHPLSVNGKTGRIPLKFLHKRTHGQVQTGLGSPRLSVPTLHWASWSVEYNSLHLYLEPPLKQNMSHLATWVWLAKVAWGGNGGASSSTDASAPNWLTRSCVLRPEHPSDQGVLAEHKPQGTVAKCPDFKMDKHEVERDPVRGFTSCKCLPGLPWVPPRCREGKSTRRDDRPLCSWRSGCSKVTRRRRLGRTDLRFWEVDFLFSAQGSPMQEES